MPNAMEWNNNSDLAIAILDQASKIVSMMHSLKAGDSFGRLVGLQISKRIAVLSRGRKMHRIMMRVL